MDRVRRVKISNKQKLKWLTVTAPTRKRAMLDTEDPVNGWHIPQYRVMPFQRQIHSPSFGNLGKLPPELFPIVFQHLTCDDLEAVHSCSTGGRIAVLACPQYHNLLQYAPNVLSILKKTRLARGFTIAQIYETFTSSLCVTCGQFGGYVFLPSFTRCCLLCAETELRFLPISRDGAKTEFGVKGKRIFDSLPQLNNIPGYYSSCHGKVKNYTQRLVLYSRELVEKLRDPEYPDYFVRHEGNKSIKAYQRYMALTPLPCFIPKSASVEKGVCCAGCEIRAKEHSTFCLGTDLRVYQILTPSIPNLVTDGYFRFCFGNGPGNQCPFVTDHYRLYDSRQILSHFQGCAAAKALLRVKGARLRKKMLAKKSRKSSLVGVCDS